MLCQYKHKPQVSEIQIFKKMDSKFSSRQPRSEARTAEFTMKKNNAHPPLVTPLAKGQPLHFSSLELCQTHYNIPDSVARLVGCWGDQRTAPLEAESS